MTPDETKKLLAVVAAFDGRKPSEATAHAWHDTANRNRWTFPEAVEAVKAHYGANTEWIMPGHVTKMIKDRRQDQALRDTATELTQPPSLPQRLVSAVKALAEGTRVPDAAPARRPNALRAACPHCGAQPGAPCTRPGLGGARRETKPHPSRRDIA